MVQHHSIQAKCTVTLDKLWQPAQGMPSEQIHHKKSSYLHLLRSSLLKLWTLGIPSDAKSMIHSIAAWRVHNFKGELAQGTKTKTQQMLQHLYTCNIYVHVSIYCIDIIESKWCKNIHFVNSRFRQNCHFSWCHPFIAAHLYLAIPVDWWSQIPGSKMLEFSGSCSYVPML